MDAPSGEEPKSPPKSCPDCGRVVEQGQRRCTNCGASVDTHKRLTRRTPLIAAAAVLVVSAGSVVVAQADVTEKATIDASAPADAASAPVRVAGSSLPVAKKPTSTAPKVVVVTTPVPTTPEIVIPSAPTDLLKAAAKAREAAAKVAAHAKAQAKAEAKARAKANVTTPAGTSVPGATTPTTPEVFDPARIKVVHTENYDPDARVGAEFSKPKAAVDKRLRTVWDVNIPADSQPFDAGIVLDLGQVTHVSSIKISTPTPGFGLVVYRSDGDTIPDKLDDRWTRAAKVQTVSNDQTVPIVKGDPEWARFILVYLTTPVAADDTRAAISDLEVLP